MSIRTTTREITAAAKVCIRDRQAHRSRSTRAERQEAAADLSHAADPLAGVWDEEIVPMLGPPQACGAVEATARIVAQIRHDGRACASSCVRQRLCNDELMGWCEANRVDYVFGLARNRRLEAALVDQLAGAKRRSAASGQPARGPAPGDRERRALQLVGHADQSLSAHARRLAMAAQLKPGKRGRPQVRRRGVIEPLAPAVRLERT